MFLTKGSDDGLTAEVEVMIAGKRSPLSLQYAQVTTAPPLCNFGTKVSIVNAG